MIKRRIYIKERSLIAGLAAKKLKSNKVAIVIGGTIHLWNTKKEDFLKNNIWVNHELTHIAQFQRYGFISFILRYAWESLLKGYKNNRYEIEARANELNYSIRDNYILPGAVI